MELDRSVAVSTLKATVQEFRSDDVLGMASEVAYRLIFALPPLLIFFAALSTAVAQYTGVDVFGYLRDQITSAAIPVSVQGTLMLLVETIEKESQPGLISFGLLLALWSGSSAISSMMKAFNRAYGVVDGRSFIKSRLIALGLTVGLSLAVIASFVLILFGNRLGSWLAAAAGLTSAYAYLWSIAHWPLTIILFLLALAVLYWAGPSVNQSFRWITPGSVLTTLLWFGATWGFGLYLRVANPGSTYGALGALVVLLFFFYVSSIVMLIGAEVNAVLDKRYNPEVVRDKASHPERQVNPRAARRRAIALSRREGEPPATLGVTPEPVRQASGRTQGPAPLPKRSRGATLAVLLSLGSLFVAALLGALHGNRASRA